MSGTSGLAEYTNHSCDPLIRRLLCAPYTDGGRGDWELAWWDFFQVVAAAYRQSSVPLVFDDRSRPAVRDAGFKGKKIAANSE